jgi:hypothetical protein
VVAIRLRRDHEARTALAVVVTVCLAAFMADLGPVRAAPIPTRSASCHSASSKNNNAVMTSIAITPRVVNVIKGAKKVTFSVKAHDPVAGITGVFVGVESPRSGPGISDVRLSRTAGTAANGTWTGSATIPRWSTPGTWTVLAVSFEDGAGDFGEYGPGIGGGFKKGWPTSFRVTSIHDVEAPTLSSLTLSTTSVNTSNQAKRIKVSAHLMDNRSGIKGPVLVSARVELGNDAFWDAPAFFTQGGLLRLTSGTSKDGTYTGSMVVPRWVRSGTRDWLLQVDASDRTGNHLLVGAYELKAKHLPTAISVTSRTDPTPPVLRGLTITPASVDASKGPKHVVVTVRAADPKSGVVGALVTFTSPSGRVADGYVHRVGGTSGSGAWQTSIVIPGCSQSGTWTASLLLEDAALNRAGYTTAQLEARHLPATLQVGGLGRGG